MPDCGRKTQHISRRLTPMNADKNQQTGTATEFPAQFAGISVTVPGLSCGVRSPFVVSPKTVKHPPPLNADERG
jgi:hypothetical protein